MPHCIRRRFGQAIVAAPMIKIEGVILPEALLIIDVVYL